MVHGDVNTTRPQCRNQVLFGDADEKEARNMGIGLHRSSQRLLRNLGKGVDIIHNDPSIIILSKRHLPNKETHLAANSLNTTVLVGPEKHAFIDGFNAP